MPLKMKTLAYIILLVLCSCSADKVDYPVRRVVATLEKTGIDSDSVKAVALRGENGKYALFIDQSDIQSLMEGYKVTEDSECLSIQQEAADWHSQQIDKVFEQTKPGNKSSNATYVPYKNKGELIDGDVLYKNREGKPKAMGFWTCKSSVDNFDVFRANAVQAIRVDTVLRAKNDWINFNDSIMNSPFIVIRYSIEQVKGELYSVSYYSFSKN